jgi:ABC-type ATPase with predicted acetyltransferase domain
MALVRCAQCGGPVVAQASSCPHCGRGTRSRIATIPGGMKAQKFDPLAVALRRMFIVALMAVVGVAWYAVTGYARSHRRVETADEKALQCDLIEDQGEDYYGELSDCRNRVAYLRAVERH